MGTQSLISETLDRFGDLIDQDHRYIVTIKEQKELQYQEKTMEDLELNFSNWCGWHNDHGSLTGLVQPLYTNEYGEPIENPDPNVNFLFFD